MPDKKDNQAKKTIWEELNAAGLPRIALLAFLAVGGYLLGVIAAIALAGVDKVGQFGDSFGALTSIFNALAFAAVVATVVLQSRELRESREQLVEQAKAQKAWADAAQRALQQAERLESVRIRPFIKAEWQRAKYGQFSYSMRNVGLGVAIITKLEVPADVGEPHSILELEPGEILPSIRARIAAAIPGERIGELTQMQLDDMNRALAPNEPQAIIQLQIANGDMDSIHARLRRSFALVIHFESVTGEKFSTRAQFPRGSSLEPFLHDSDALKTK